MVASSLLSDAAFVSDGSSYAVHQLVLLLGSAMTALNACVEAKEKEATWEVTTHHCLASLGFIAGFVPFLKDASILEDFCRYVMSVLPCVLEANLADEVLVKDAVLLMEKMSRFVDGEKRDDVMGEMESVVVEKKVLVSAELEKRCEEEEESDSSSYTYESYYSYETVSDEELPPSMPTLVSAPEKPAKEEEKPVEVEEDWGFEEEKEEEKEEVKEPVEEKVEVKKVEVKEDKKDKKKAEVNEEKKEEKPEEKKVKKVEVKEVKEEKKPVEEKKAEVKKEEKEKPEEKEEKPVEEKKKEPSVDKNSTSTALARTEKKLEVDEHLWDDDDEPVKPARATRRGRKKEEVKKEEKEKKPVAKPVEEAKPEVKKEEKPVEEKPEEKTEEKEEKKVEVKKEEEKKPSVDKNSTSTALARTEKKLEVDEHLWDDDDEPVKPARATRRGRKKEKAPVERVVIEPPLRSEKLFSDDEEEKKPKKTRRGRSGRSQALATFEASWDEEEVKPAEAKVEEKPVEDVKVEEKHVEEVKVEEKPVEKETKPAEKEVKEEKVEKKEEKAEEKAEEKEKKEENWDFASDNDSGLEWSDQEQSATAPTPTNTPTPTTPTNTPTTPTNTPTPTTPTNTPTPTTPITIISSTTIASYTAVPDMTPLCTSPTTTSPVLLQACRVLDLLLSSSLLLPACHCFQCYIPAVKKEPSLLCHFVDKLVRQIGAREMKEEEAKALTEIVTILVEDNECVTRAASDLVLELFLAFQKKEEVSCIPKQLVLLVLSFYQQKREPWLITVFIHMFSAALSRHSMEQVTQCLVLLVATLQKLNAEDSQFLIAVCGMPIIDAILSVWSVMDKEALAALVPFAALLYGKTEKKEEIVELVLHLCGIALKRSIQLQPLNVKKCDEDADLVKVNSMIGELLFVMVRVNAESFKKGLQCLPAEKVSVIQEQLRHTIQVKQSETNAAKRRNASRMPVKLDASKFTNE